MKKILAIIVLLATAAVSARAEVFELKAGPFDKLSVRGDFNVIYRNVPDSTGYVVYESDTNLDDKLKISIKKGKLTIKPANIDETFSQVPTFYVYSDFLVNVATEGKGTTVLDLTAAIPTFSAKQVGNGKIIINGLNTTTFKANIETGNGAIIARGKCNTANFKLTGTGVIQADGLAANEVNCTVLGTGTIGCHPLDVLDVRGIGTSKIFYYGSPTIKKVGAATLKQLEGTPEGSKEETEIPQRQ